MTTDETIWFGFRCSKVQIKHLEGLSSQTRHFHFDDLIIVVSIMDSTRTEHMSKLQQGHSKTGRQMEREGDVNGGMWEMNKT